MKQSILFTTTFFLLLCVNLFATRVNEPLLNKEILQSFKQDFNDAINVSWTKSGELYKVSFAKDNTSFAAYYTEGGELSVTARIIFQEQLPFSVLKAIRKSYTQDEVLSIHEYTNRTEPSYYFIHVSRNNKIQIMKFNSDGWFEILK